MIRYSETKKYLKGQDFSAKTSMLLAGDKKETKDLLKDRIALASAECDMAVA